MKKLKDFENLPSFIRDYLSHKFTIEGKSELTVKEYAYDLQTFLRYITAKQKGIKDISEIKKLSVKNADIGLIRDVSLSDVYDYLLFLSKSMGNSVKSRARKLSSLKSFYKYLDNDAHLINVNIVKDLQLPKIPKQLPIYLELDEAKTLLQAPEGENKERDFLILIILLNCGLRVSELKNIHLNDIKGDTLLIKGKGQKERILFLNPSALKALDAYLNVRKPRRSDITQLILSDRGEEISVGGIQYTVKKLVKKAGLDSTRITTHKLRHTAATLMYKYGGVDVRALQEVLGHEHLNTTEIYTHTDREAVRNALNKNPLSGYKK